MAWIKVYQQLKDHRKILAAADELDIDHVHMLGMLISFWLWALDNAPSGSLEGISHRMIAKAAQWGGDPELFVEAMENAGLLDEKDDGELEIHDWYEYTGKLIDKREAEKNRSRRRRAAAAAATEDDRRTPDGQTAGRPTDDQETTAHRVEKSREEKRRVDNLYISPKGDKSSESPEAPEPAPPADQTPYKAIVAMYHDICKSYPSLRNISERRKKAIAARWKEYGHDLDTFRELFELAEASPFLKGKNTKNWAADFNWLMNSENMAKVLEGKYSDKPKGGQDHGGINENSERQAHRESSRSEASLSGFHMAY